MEESIKKFTDFLGQIIWAESSSEHFRNIICAAPGGPKALFKALDRWQAGAITCNDILAFCQENGVRIYSKSAAVIGWYLGVGEEGMDWSQFANLMSPSNSREPKASIKAHNSVAIFLQMITHLTKAYGILSSARMQLYHYHLSNIREYFHRKYSDKYTINAQSIR
jgi:hypothetical protein